MPELESSSIADTTPDERLTVHRVVKECRDYMTLSDGHIYCKRSSGLKGYYCPPTFRHRVAVTEGNAMFTGWAAEAHDTECRYDLPHRTGSTLAARRPGRFGPLIGSC